MSQPDRTATPRSSYVVGTAGHIDHGKSTLVRALTGIDPDRLAEEKSRGMTIDLGFAWFRTPAGTEISLVDVPGHERFIKNMLAGVGGIDAAILVIAADEGPMPQTAEHLAILDLLQVSAGVVALTKTDLVDEDWLELVTEEVRERLAGTVLADAPIVAVSSQTGAGLDRLMAELDRILSKVDRSSTGTVARLPVDRVFSVAGFGTVVTGTLTGGPLAVGQELTLYPDQRSTRIRGLQTHGERAEQAAPGTRVAVNVAGLAVEDVDRGDVLAPPGRLTPTQRIDVQLHLLKDSPVSLTQNDQVDLFIGATERPAWLTLLDRERIEPGETAWVQMRLRQPLVTLKGDRFIVRRPSPSLTIGGGVVIDPLPTRHRRFRPEVLSALETKALGSPDELLLQALDAGPIEVKTLRSQPPAGLSEAEAIAAIEQLLAEGEARFLHPDGSLSRPGDTVATTSWWMEQHNAVKAIVDAFHRANPLRKGMPREEVRSRLRVPGANRVFDDFMAGLVVAGAIVEEGSTVRLPSFSIVLDPARQATADAFLAAIANGGFNPPAPAECGVDAETLGALIDQGKVIKAAEGVVFDPAAYAELERQVLALIDRDGTITLAGYRDHFQSSRKYAQAMLEHLDQRRVTRRIGDARVRFSGSAAVTKEESES